MAKGTRVTQKEKEKMWQLYQQLGSFKKVAKKLRRCPDTVSRYVREYEAAVGAAGYILNQMQKGIFIMAFLIVLLSLVVIAALLYLQYIIAKEFYSAAVTKGYSNKKYLWYCFFLGMIGYLMVIALPNKIVTTNQSADELPEI